MYLEAASRVEQSDGFTYRNIIFYYGRVWREAARFLRVAPKIAWAT